MQYNVQYKTKNCHPGLNPYKHLTVWLTVWSSTPYNLYINSSCRHFQRQEYHTVEVLKDDASKLFGHFQICNIKSEPCICESILRCFEISFRVSGSMVLQKLKIEKWDDIYDTSKGSTAL